MKCEYLGNAVYSTNLYNINTYIIKSRLHSITKRIFLYNTTYTMHKNLFCIFKKTKKQFKIGLYYFFLLNNIAFVVLARLHYVHVCDVNVISLLN